MNIDLYHLIKDKGRIETIFDFLPYPFLISEYRFGTYRNLHLNSRFIEEIGFALEEIPTIDDWFLAAYPDVTYREEVIEAWNKKSESAKRKNEDSLVIKVKIHTKAKGERWYEVKASTSGGMQMVAFVNMEETMARKKELERLVENKNRTLSILAHDLRTPISNLHSMTQLLLMDKLSHDEFIKETNVIYQKSAQVLEFIDNTLHWTKSNFENIQVQKEKVLLENILRNIFELYEHIYKNKSINIFTEIEPYPLETDNEILTILLRNIISNAIKFTYAQGVIKIEGKRNLNSFCISIEDSGVGMTKESIDKIFQNNYTSTRGTKAEKGLGIGLKLCRQLISKVNGNLEIESTPGKGTKVNLIFND
jgi:signal transduction histidine kinase